MAIKVEKTKIPAQIGFMTLMGVCTLTRPVLDGNSFSFRSGEACVNMCAEDFEHVQDHRHMDDVEVLRIYDDEHPENGVSAIVVDPSIPREFLNPKGYDGRGHVRGMIEMVLQETGQPNNHHYCGCEDAGFVPQILFESRRDQIEGSEDNDLIVHKWTCVRCGNVVTEEHVVRRPKPGDRLGFVGWQLQGMTMYNPGVFGGRIYPEHVAHIQTVARFEGQRPLVRWSLSVRVVQDRKLGKDEYLDQLTEVMVARGESETLRGARDAVEDARKRIPRVESVNQVFDDVVPEPKEEKEPAIKKLTVD